MTIKPKLPSPPQPQPSECFTHALCHVCEAVQPLSSCHPLHLCFMEWELARLWREGGVSLLPCATWAFSVPLSLDMWTAPALGYWGLCFCEHGIQGFEILLSLLRSWCSEAKFPDLVLIVFFILEELTCYLHNFVLVHIIINRTQGFQFLHI